MRHRRPKEGTDGRGTSPGNGYPQLGGRSHKPRCPWKECCLHNRCYSIENSSGQWTPVLTSFRWALTTEWT